MKVIFLDIDNVLNYDRCGVIFEGYYFVVDKKIELLKELVDSSGAKIVLSSTWREGWYAKKEGKHNFMVRLYEALENKLKEFNLEITGHTPLIDHLSRGLEIDKWLRDWDGEQIESFVILDDMEPYFFRPHQNRLVHTMRWDGLLSGHVEEAKKVLEIPVQ